MRFIRFLPCFIFAAVLSVAPPAARGDGISYPGSFSDYVAGVARRSGKPLLVEFLSRTSGDPSRLDSLYRNPEVRKRLWKFNTVPRFEGLARFTSPMVAAGRRSASHPSFPGVMRIFIEDFGFPAGEWNIRSTPCHVILSAEGRIIGKLSVPVGADEFAKFLDRALPSDPPLPSDSNKKIFPEKNAFPKEEIPMIPLAVRRVPATAVGAEEVRASGTFPDGAMPGRAAADFLRQFETEGVWKISLAANPPDVDLDLEVLNARGEPLACAEGETGQEELLVAVMPGFEYILRVQSVRETFPLVTFQLVESLSPSESGALTPSPEAAILKEGSSVSADAAAGERTQFRFTPLGPGDYLFSATMNSLEAPLLLLDAEGRKIAEGAGALRISVARPGSLTLVVIPGKMSGGKVRIEAGVTRERTAP